MYSSGTTGVPKCIVHGAGGTLCSKHMKEHILHCRHYDRDDRLFFFTTCGWMMWNWLVSALDCPVQRFILYRWFTVLLKRDERSMAHGRRRES